jgi:hypothetical protein
MTLLAVVPRRLLAVAFAPYTGKGTGERALVREILAHQTGRGLLFLLDAGLYALDLLWDLVQKGGAFIVKVPAQVKFRRCRRLADGSWLAEVTGQIVEPEVFSPDRAPSLENRDPDGAGHPDRNTRLPPFLANDQPARPGHPRPRDRLALSSALGY